MAIQSAVVHSADPVKDSDLEHPRGTFAIVIIFGVLFAAGWLAMYVFGFLHRGVPHA